MFDDLIELLRKVAEGNSDALERSGMEEVTEGNPLSVNLSSRDLQAEHYRTSMVKACCEILGLGTMAQVCQKHIDILNVCCRKFHNITLQPITFDPQDYADTMQHLVFELSQKLVSLAKTFSVAASETALQPPCLPATDEPQPETSTNVIEVRSNTVTEASTSTGLEEASPSQPPCDSAQEPGPSSPKKSSRKKFSPKKSSKKRVHYKERKCPLCCKKVVNMRRHLISMHSQRNEMIPVAKVEALLQASRHGKQTTGGRAHKKSKDGSTKIYQRKKRVCPLCDAVTAYLTTHLQRVHRLKKRTLEYNEALTKVRPYLGRSKEIKRLEKNLIEEKVVKKTSRKRYFKEVEAKVQKAGPSKAVKRAKSWALQTLIDEVSDGTDSEYDNIMPPTPPVATQTEDQGVEQPLDKEDVEQEEEHLEEEDNPEYEESDDNSEYQESDDEIEECTTWKTYYEKGKVTTIREKLLVMFYQHLRECFGGCKKVNQAVLYAQNVRRIHDFLDPNKDDATFESLLKDGGVIVWRSWARPMLESKKMRPGSVRSYLLSLAKFCEFVVDHVVNKVDNFPSIPEDVVERAGAIASRFKGMCSTVSKEYAHAKWEKQMEDEQNAVPTSVIEKMMESKKAQEAIRYLTLSYNNKPSESIFLSIRNYLIARLAIENCQRPGPFETATLREFECAKEVDEKFVMSVSRHKTSRAGPAPITMTPNTMSNLRAYVKYVRPHFAKPEVDTLFVTKEGESFQPGTIGRCIQKWWKQATGLDISSTALRKVGSTETMNEDLETQKAVQAVMTHRRTTAEQHYQILKRTKQAVKGHDALAKKLGLQDSVATNFPESPIKSPGKSSSPGKSPGKSSFSEDQLTDIDLLFSQQIATNAPITFVEVKNIMSESLNLISEVHDPAMVRKVYDRVRYLQKKNFQQGLDRVEDDSTQKTSDWVTSVSSVVSGPSRRFCWSQPDVDMITNSFLKYSNCPLKREIEQIFQGDKALQEIMERNTFNRCYEKVKTIFKQRKK